MDVAYYLILWAKLGKAACLSGPLYHHDQIGTVCSRCATFPSSMEAISAEDNFYLSASFQAKWFCIKFRHCCLLLNGFLIPLLANEWAYAQLTLSIQQMWNKKLIQKPMKQDSLTYFKKLQGQTTFYLGSKINQN